MNIISEFEQSLAFDPSTSNWLKDQFQVTQQSDPVDALFDAQTLVTALKARVKAIEERAFLDSGIAAKTKAKQEAHRAAKSIELTLEVLSNVRNFKELVALDNSVIEGLIHFELAHIEYLELTNEGIDYQTSGHYKDVLDIYNDALKGVLNDGCNIHHSNDENNELSFNIADRLKIYI